MHLENKTLLAQLKSRISWVSQSDVAKSILCNPGVVRHHAHMHVMSHIRVHDDGLVSDVTS